MNYKATLKIVKSLNRHERYILKERDFSHKTSYCDYDMPQLSDFDIQALIEKKELILKLHKLLDTLSPDETRLIHRLYFARISLVKAAKMENIPESTFRYRRNKLLKKLNILLSA